MRNKITDVQIRQWIRAGQYLAKAQGEVPGLTLTISKAGTATWILRFRINGQQKELTLGRYPEYGIKDAKDLAIAARRKVMDGIDPAQEKRQSKVTRAGDQLFKSLALDYEQKAITGLADNTRDAKKYHIHSWLIPRLGNVKAKDIIPADIVELVEAAGERSHSTAVLIFGTLSRIFDHGIGKSIIATNPCKGIKVSAVLGAAPEKRIRVKLTEDELRLLLPALDDDRNGIVVRLLLITAVRINELLRAEWQHIDFDRAEWIIPDEHAKTKQGFVIPLPSVAVELFKRLEVLACGSPYVLPGQGRIPVMNGSTVIGYLGRLRDRLPAIRKFTPHDLRSTCRSHLSSLGISVVVAERCLNHTLGGIVAVYDLHDYLDERRRALTLWADYLTAIEQGKPWISEADNVVQLRNR